MERQEVWYVPSTAAHLTWFFRPPSSTTIILSAFFFFFHTVFTRAYEPFSFFFSFPWRPEFVLYAESQRRTWPTLPQLVVTHAALIWITYSICQITSSNVSARCPISGEPQTCIVHAFFPDELGCLFLAPFFSSSLAVNVSYQGGKSN